VTTAATAKFVLDLIAALATYKRCRGTQHAAQRVPAVRIDTMMSTMNIGGPVGAVVIDVPPDHG
jgi:hypothetical protein